MMNDTIDKPPTTPRLLYLVWIYAGFSSLWIVTSDSLLVWLPSSPEQTIEFSILKGLLFVTITSLLLHALLRRATLQFRQAAQREERLLREKLHALHLLDTIANSSTDAIFAKDNHGRYVLFNKAAEVFVGKPALEVLGKTDTAIFPPENAALVMADDQRIMAENKVCTYEHTLSTAHGTRVFLTTQGPLQDTDGKICGVFGVARDITERKNAEAQLRKLSLAVEQSPESIIITDLDAKIEYVNQAFVNNSGYSREEVYGQTPRILHSGKMPPQVYVGMWETLTAGRVWEGELHNQRRDGSEYTDQAIISPIRQADGHITHYVAVQQDITEKNAPKRRSTASRSTIRSPICPTARCCWSA